MINIPDNIFRMYDIRGIYQHDLTDEIVTDIGKGLGSFFQKKRCPKVFVGRDNRISSPRISEILIKNLLCSGCDVVDLGIAINPCVYYTWYFLDADASVIITASHNPAEYNGFKVAIRKKPLLEGDYQEIKNICKTKEFVSGSGKLSHYNIWPDYLTYIKKNISIKKPLKVAVDCGNGTVSLFGPKTLKQLGCEVTPFFCQSDGSFPNHQPYPQKTEYYGEMVKFLKSGKADVGLAFDGDGDRLGVYDEKGAFVECDRLAMILAEDICRKIKNPTIVMNISTSVSVSEYIEKCGANFILWKTGYVNISDKMKETKAVFGGEISGHFFFADRYFGYDDALYATFRLLEILSASSRALSEIIADLPRYYETPELRIKVSSDKEKFSIINWVKKEIVKDFPEVKIIDIDGIRFSFSDGWGLVRASNTEPALTTRAEAKTPQKLEQIKEIITNKLTEKGAKFTW